MLALGVEGDLGMRAALIAGVSIATLLCAEPSKVSAAAKVALVGRSITGCIRLGLV